MIKNSRHNFDIIQSISYVLALSPLTWGFQHIPGHQDDVTEFDSLPCHYQLNVLADLKAKNEVLAAIDNGTVAQSYLQLLPYVQCEIRTVDQIVVLMDCNEDVYS